MARPKTCRIRPPMRRSLAAIPLGAALAPSHRSAASIWSSVAATRSSMLAPGREVACAYHERWEIEIVIDEIDTHQRLVGRTLRSLTPVGVIQELYGILLAHYAVRFLMHEAALTSDVDVDRLSFVHAVEV